MQFLFIDESGSMTKHYSDHLHYFVIAIVRTERPKVVRTVYKRFITKYLSDLRVNDSKKRMFNNGSFKELKGALFSPELKESFVSYFCRNNILQVFYVVIDNHKILSRLYDNKARAFNYSLRLSLEYFIRNGLLPDEEYCIQSDERNERAESRHFLQSYLNTELRMNGVLTHDVTVSYFDSANNQIIQVADVFANLYYSHLMTGRYEKEINEMQENGYLGKIFNFPL